MTLSRLLQAGTALLGAVALLSLPGCNNNSGKVYTPPTLSDGVIFTYPIDNQTDVPTDTRFYVTFSKAVDATAVNAACSVDGGGNVTGNFCLIGPSNSVVAITPTVSGKVVRFESAGLQEGTQYSLYVRGAVIGGGTTNLPDTAPLLTFTTSQIDPIAGVAPTVVAINGENAGAYQTLPTALTNPPTPRFPFMDFATVRVQFSEPVDEKTVTMGGASPTFEFVKVNSDSTETPVVGSLMVRRQHLSFDPDSDLTPGATYRLRFNAGIKDLNGEALAPATYELVPQNSNACNCVITQEFHTTAAIGDPGNPATSVITGRPLNAIDLYSPLIGANDFNIKSGTVEAQLADPSSFPNGLIPFVIRKGNVLNITGLNVALGGAVPANLATGDIKATFLDDATGFMSRNPFRSSSTLPDDNKSPVFVYLIFDLSLTATDAKGNAVLNQTIPHVQATGTARVENGKLYIETVRTLDMDLLGLDLAPAHLVLGLNSDLSATTTPDTVAPTITASYPADGGTDFPIRDGISLVFSEPIDNAGLVANDQIQLMDTTSSALVPFQFKFDGSTVQLLPDSPLSFGHNYQITLGSLTDISDNHNPLSLDPSDATGGDGVITFSTENPSSSTPVGPMVSSIHNGAGCAITGTTYAHPGYCVGGKSTDDPYLPFDMPTDGYLDVQFNQPMDQNTLVLGTTCDTGQIRVETIDSGGNCTGVVPGSLTVDTRSIRFKPTTPWVEGTDYRVTLVAGSNATCDAGEICGTDGLPLNSDPLNGAAASKAGGANIVQIFRGVAASDDVYLPLKLEPIADINGNGFLDSGESIQTANSVNVSVTGWSGVVTSASMVGDSHIYLSGSMPVVLSPPEPLTVDGTPWGMTIAGTSQIPVTVNPGILYGTSITIHTVAAGILPIDTPTNLNMLRLRESNGQPIVGYIVQEDGVAEPQFIAKMDLYMDAPDMTILSGVGTHDVHSKEVAGVLVKGPITFQPDGRILIQPVNVNDINLTVNISALGLPGSISLQIPAGQMQLTLSGNPLKGRR